MSETPEVEVHVTTPETPPETPPVVVVDSEVGESTDHAIDAAVENEHRLAEVERLAREASEDAAIARAGATEAIATAEVATDIVLANPPEPEVAEVHDEPEPEVNPGPVEPDETPHKDHAWHKKLW